MNKKKRNKIIAMIDPEPKRCFVDGRDCGTWERPEKTGILMNDLLTENVYRYIPRRVPQDYINHSVGCLWAEWAKREIARNM